MDELRGSRIIETFQKKWNRQNVLAYVILSLAIVLFASALFFKLFSANWFIFPVVLTTLLFAAIFLFRNKIEKHDVVKFLNEAFPELEESSNLLLKPYESLNVLEKLQVKKVQNKLQDNIPQPDILRRKIKRSLAVFVVALLLTTVFFVIPFNSIRQGSNAVTSANLTTQKPETKLPQVEAVEMKITPPPYTRKAQREQDRFNVVAEQDAVLEWRITTTIKVKEAALIFNDKSVLRLQSDRPNTNWSGSKPIKSSGFYQVSIEGNLSELYQVEMIKDQPPVIMVQSPKPNTVIEYGQTKTVSINVSLSDDYGISSAFIKATTASGSGEAVKFKEQQISFANFGAGNRQYQLQKQIDLAALGMQPGDELYFYINARDNYRQEKRSDVYIVRMEDTAQLMSMEGLVSGVDLKPEFFRSQRQIIIETEQLLKNRDTISVESFNKKSADLGIDQKLLRLRYGKFLGEENEPEPGAEHDDDEKGHNASDDKGNGNNILDQYSHKHDIAEDATFFDAKTKKQLQATLSEMWKAELQLRTYKPKEALPFEYKALRLLKDLQQQTRAYVGKTGSKTTPLKPEIRLTGDLSKVAQPVVERDFEQRADPATTLRKALGILEQVRNNEVLQRSSIEILAQASMQLSIRAASEPSKYLASLEALRRILNGNYKFKDVSLAGSAFQRMIGSVANVPQRSKTAPDVLSQRYFKNLSRKND